MQFVVVALGLALILLVVYGYVSTTNRLRRSVQSLYTPPEDLRRAGDDPPPEPQTNWLSINPYLKYRR